MKKRIFGATAASLMLVGGMAFASAPAGAVVINFGSCQNLLALGTAKSATVGDGITDKDNQDVSIGTKGVDPNTLKGTNLGSCSFLPGLSTPDNVKPPVKGFSGTHNVLKWGTKLYSPESDCNTADTGDNTEWPLNGTLSITFSDLNGIGKNYAISAGIAVTGFSDPDNDPNTPSDVVQFHGLVTKGVAAGADVTGESEFDPTIKDKLQTTASPYFGYSFDLAGAAGCTTATVGDANILAFNNGSVGGQSQLLALPVAGITFSIGS